MTTTTSTTMMKAGLSTSWRRRKSSLRLAAVVAAAPAAHRAGAVERAAAGDPGQGAEAWAAGEHPDRVEGPVAVGVCLAPPVGEEVAAAEAPERHVAARRPEAR
jgi:hypothetical protein